MNIAVAFESIQINAMALNIDQNSDFSLWNLPFGIFSANGGAKQVGVAVGDYVFNLTKAVRNGLFSNVPLTAVSSDFLNDFISLGKSCTNGVREKLIVLFQDLDGISDYILSQEKVTMHLPVRVGDYTDFYSSEEHARNVGELYRDPENALMPNWKHLPVGYHGRSSSIVVSGTEIKRPAGQVKPSASTLPYYTKTRALDFELETGFVIGKNTELGQCVTTDNASDYIFGMVLLNDWSARDIQKWEYVPLGPFLGKNFATSISPWVVTYEALSPFKVQGPSQDPEVLPYLRFKGHQNIDLKLQVKLNGSVISNSNFKYMYWNMHQQLAHHTVNGCNLRVGDIMGSGTISGEDESAYGSMLELSRGGKRKVLLDDGSERTFLEDGDLVEMSGHCEKDGRRIGFGKVSGKIKK